MNMLVAKGNKVLKPAVLAAAVATLSPAALAADSIAAAIDGGKISGNVRLRFESVDDDAFAKEAEAMTLRTRLGYETAPAKGFSVVAELEGCRSVLGVDYYAPERAG